MRWVRSTTFNLLRLWWTSWCRPFFVCHHVHQYLVNFVSSRSLSLIFCRNKRTICEHWGEKLAFQEFLFQVLISRETKTKSENLNLINGHVQVHPLQRAIDWEKMLNSGEKSKYFHNLKFFGNAQTTKDIHTFYRKRDFQANSFPDF